MAIKVDFGLTMITVTHNLFRLFASNADRYQHKEDQTIYEQFLDNAGDIIIDKNKICIEPKKKRTQFEY